MQSPLYKNREKIHLARRRYFFRRSSVPGQNGWRGFRRRHEKELAVNTATAKGFQRAPVTSKSVLDYFDKLKEVRPNCMRF
jgi:hypothetical protein